MEKTVLVIGHRNPDTDSVCSAIAYAYLKQQLGLNAVPARCRQDQSGNTVCAGTFWRTGTEISR